MRRSHSFSLPTKWDTAGGGTWSRRRVALSSVRGSRRCRLSMCLEKFQGEKAMRSFLKSGTLTYPQSAALYFRRFAGPGLKDYALGLPAAGSDASAALHDIADTKGMFV